MSDAEVLCVGEVLWDSLPAGIFLGGAPLNVAGHLRALGVPAAMVSRVGRDHLGAEALQRVARYGVSADLVQVDPRLPTGFVSVTLDAEGVPAYDITRPAAWDAIELAEGLPARAARARALVYGTLAQRDATSRETIRGLWAQAGLRVFDVNLRPPHDEREVVERSLENAHVVKLNEDELGRMAGWFGLPRRLPKAVPALAEAFGLGTVCVTRGAAGAVLLHEGRWSEHPGYRVQPKDTVGAGDAFLAALLEGLLAGRDDVEVLRQANLLGAYVATQPGAIPVYHPEIVAAIREAERRAPEEEAR